MSRKCSIVECALILCCVLSCLPSRCDEATGQLSLLVVVLDELTPKPVPLTDFWITQEFGDHGQKTIRTDESGKAVIDLLAGQFTVESVQPVTFKGKSLMWKKTFTIDTGKTTELKLTEADSSQDSGTPARQVSDEAKVYQRLKNGVVTVESDFGSGSGFVVDPRGIVLTNQHVINNTHWTAIRFEQGIRLEATVLDEDKEADVAVLLFNPEGYKQATVVPIADTSKGAPVVVGEKVLAIGSPLGREKILTTGIISKVETDVLFSDVNINPGNSGGPLLNLAGEVIGINTFGLPTSNGPGVSGIVAIQKAIPVLTRGRDKVGSTQPPSAELLPVVSAIPIPLEALSEAAKVEIQPYVIKGADEFRTRIITPFCYASDLAADERALKKGKGKRVQKRSSQGLKEEEGIDPARFYERISAVVDIYMLPKLEETSASKRRGFFGGLGSIIVRAPIRTGKEYKFQNDFYDMQLFRGESPVHPVRRLRIPDAILFHDLGVKVKDKAYGGLYRYDPSAFEPGRPLTIRFRRETNLDKWISLTIDEKTQQSIWAEFAPWREAVAKSGR